MYFYLYFIARHFDQYFHGQIDQYIYIYGQIDQLDNGFFDLDTEEILESTSDLDIITITKALAKLDQKFIEDTSSNLCATFNLKYTTPNCLYKKLENNKRLLEQCNVTYSKRRSNGKNLIKIELLEENDE